MKARMSVAVVAVLVGWFPAWLAGQSTKAALTNNDVVQMVSNGLAENVVIGAIFANEANFDVSPKGLLGLRQAKVSDAIVEAMLSAQGKRRELSAASAGRDNGPRVGAMGVPIMSSPAAEAPPQLPKVTLLMGEQKLPLEPSSTEIAQSKGKGGSTAGGILKGVGKGMLMAGNMAGVPAPSGGGGGNARMPGVAYTWALPGRTSSLALPGRSPTFEIEFADIPGIDPDGYEPTIVKLIPTKDNWRLVETSKEKFDKHGNDTRSSKTEGKTPLKITSLGRGHVQVTPVAELETGEYGLVLHPKKNQKEFAGVPTPNADALFVSVWDFSVKP